MTKRVTVYRVSNIQAPSLPLVNLSNLSRQISKFRVSLSPLRREDSSRHPRANERAHARGFSAQWPRAKYCVQGAEMRQEEGSRFHLRLND